MIDLNKVSLFVKVVETGSFSGAARALGLPKASVSRHVAQLEAALGVRLLHRTTRKLQLTTAGQGYFEQAACGLALIESAKRGLLAIQCVPKGTVRIAAPVEFGNRVLADWITEFLVTFDQVTIELILDDRPLDVIDERIDIAFQAGQPENKDLVARALWQATTILFASPNYMARKGEPRSIRDLQDHDFVVQSRALQGASIRLAGPTGLRTITPKGRFAVNSSRAALRAARAGLGIVLLPKILAKEALAKGELQQILPRFESEPSTFHLVYPTKKNLSAAARRFLEFILEVAPRKYLHARHGKETGSQSISASAR